MNFNGDITDDRLDELKEIIKNKGMKISFKDFAIYEIEIIINQTVLNDVDKEFAKLKYIKNMTNEKISERMGWSSPNTVISHCNKVSHSLKMTCQRIFK